MNGFWKRSTISVVVVAIAGLIGSSFAAAQGPYFGRWRPWLSRWNDPWASPYGIYYDQSAQRAEFVLPPIYMPGELAYGPQAVKPFLGVDRNFGLGPLVDPPPSPPATTAADVAALKLLIADHLARREAAKKEDLAVWKGKLPISGLDSRQRAMQFVAFGDARFQAQEFHAALERYKTAASLAPELAEPYWKQGFARLGLGQLDGSVDSFRRGLTLDPAWPKSDFRLENLYGRDRVAREMHLEVLGRTALEKPEDAAPHFLLGVLLHWGGHAEVSRRMLEKAASLKPEWRVEAERFKP